MAILCRQLGLLYIQVPATGCSVVAKVLREHFDGEPVGGKHFDLSKVLTSKDLMSADVEDLLIVANVRNPYDRFVSYFQRLKSGWVDQEYLAVRERQVERDVASGTLSQREHAEQQQKLNALRKRLRRRERWLRYAPFDSWYLLTMARWARTSSGPEDFVDRYLFPMLGGVDLVLKQERLGEAFGGLLQRLGAAETPSLPKRNITPGKRAYVDYYGVLAKRHARRSYTEELNRFGYSFEGETDQRLMTALNPRGEAFLNGQVDLPAVREKTG